MSHLDRAEWTEAADLAEALEAPEVSPGREVVALVPPKRDIPRMQLARSLDEAGPRTFVYVDSKGRVRSPTLYKTVQAVGYSALFAIVLGGTALYTSMFGPAGALVGVIFALVAVRSMMLTRQINQAALLSSHDHLDDAEFVLRRLVRKRFLARRLRALAHHNLGAVATRRGDHAEALSELRKAVVLYQASWRKSPHLRSCQYGEVIALCNLGRVDEANQRLLSLPREPQGDYLLVKHWTTQLYVDFCRKETRLPETDLWERAQRALRITASSALLTLCSWAYQQAGDRDMAWHLLRESYDRLDGVPLSRTMPPLWRWMEANRKEAGVVPHAGASSVSHGNL
jgi:tetratricopeptide (TPR) repeat protein